MNHLFRKIGPPNKHLHKKQKIDLENLKRIMNEQKTTLRWNTKKHRMENNQNANGKKRSSINIYTNKKYNRIKWTNLCWSKISLWENQGSLKEHEQKIKTWDGNSTGNADKTIWKQTKTIKKGKTLKHVGIKRKKQHLKNSYATWGNKPESTGERRKIKNISAKGKTIQTKRNIQKQRKKILLTS